MNLFHRTIAVDHVYALRIRFRNGQELPAHAREKRRTFAFDAVFIARRGGVALTCALHSMTLRDVDQNRAVRPQSLAGDAVERLDGLRAQLPSLPLIRSRRIREAIAQHHVAFLQRRQDHFADVLRARSEIQQGFGTGIESLGPGIQHDVAQYVAHGRAARLASQQDLAAMAAQPPHGHVDLSGLTAAVQAFEGDEESTQLERNHSMVSLQPMEIAADIAANIAANLAEIHRRIAAAEVRAARQPGSVQLLAVSKTFPPPPIREAYDAGQRHFGENRIQEFESKIAQMRWDGAVWHMIGHVQSNKAARAAQLFDVIHAVDSVSLARRLNDQRLKMDAAALQVFIEVKLSDEAAKTGATESEAESLAAEIRRMERLVLRGVMTMPPWSLDAEVARPYFRRLHEIGTRIGVTEFSMGMTNDFETAIEEGSTIVRVGTAIFGKREKAGIL